MCVCELLSYALLTIIRDRSTTKSSESYLFIEHVFLKTIISVLMNTVVGGPVKSTY